MSKKFLVVDTEGVNNVPPKGNNLGSTALVYDLGIVVADREGNVYDKFSIVNTDVFYDINLMNTAYYADKLPQYHAGVGDYWEPMSWQGISQLVRSLVMDYKISDVWAYNVAYDQAALNYTTAQASGKWRKFFMPYGIRYRDIWDYAGSTLCATSKYVRWCIEHGFVSKSGNPSTSADTVGKYLRKSMDYREEHTALSDAEDELAILLACFRRKQKAAHSKGQGWKPAAKIARELKKSSCIA